jgi:putative DNA primase/helicase
MARSPRARTEKHSTDVAMLVGARLVTASETEAGKRWDEAKVKSMTGGDPITARFMRQDNFTFYPAVQAALHRQPQAGVRTVDKAMKRRIQMVPFTVTRRASTTSSARSCARKGRRSSPG